MGLEGSHMLSDDRSVDSASDGSGSVYGRNLFVSERGRQPQGALTRAEKVARVIRLRLTTTL